MPVLALTNTVIPPAPPPVPPINPLAGDVEPVWKAKRILWTGINGDVVDLTDYQQGFHSLRGRSGLDAQDPEVTLLEQPQGGAILQGVRVGSQIMTVPLMLRGSDPDHLRDLRKRFMASLRQPPQAWAGTGLALGRIDVVAHDNTTRWRPATWYALGSPTEGDDKRTWTAAGLQFACPYPYWQGNLRELSLAFADPGAWFSDDPGTDDAWPGVLSPSYSTGSNTISVEGDAPQTWPLVTATGPGTPLIRSETLDAEWTTTRPLTATETLVVDHRPRSLGGRWARGVYITDSGGEPVDSYAILGRYPSLFPLAWGDNELTLTMDDFGVSSSILFRWADEFVAAS